MKKPYGLQGQHCPRPACTGTLEAWDCGCSFGCDLCWATSACPVCHSKFTRVHRERHPKKVYPQGEVPDHGTHVQ